MGSAWDGNWGRNEQARTGRRARVVEVLAPERNGTGRELPHLGGAGLRSREACGPRVEVVSRGRGAGRLDAGTRTDPARRDTGARRRWSA